LTTERPSGVRSKALAIAAVRASSTAVMPRAGMNATANATAIRLPMVIVPVLSSSNASTSPAASTARPDIAMTLRRNSRSMPAMPIAGSRPPIVVGIRQTSKATRITKGTAVL
jgi:hypothetical protein